MYCKNCGNEVNDGAEFCPKCGSKVLADGTEAKNGLGVLEIITIVLFSVQVITYIFQIVFLDRLLVHLVGVTHDSFYDQLKAEGIYNIFWIISFGMPFFITGILFIIAIIKDSNLLYIVGIITGIVFSVGRVMSFWIYLVFFVLLLLKYKWKKIPNIVLIIIDVLATLVSVYTIEPSPNVFYDFFGKFASYQAFTIGTIAGGIAYVILVMIIDKKKNTV